MAIRYLAALGAVGLLAIVDGTIGGIVAAIWGDWWGCVADDLAISLVAFAGIWRWTEELLPHGRATAR